MSKQKFFLSILFTFALLGCALTARLQEEAPTPTVTLTVAMPSVTPRSPTLTPTPSPSPAPPTSESPSDKSGLQNNAEPSASPTVETPQETVQAPPPLPQDVTLMRQPVSADDLYSAMSLATHEVPVRDLRSLAIRLRGVRPDVPETIGDVSPDYPVGTLRTFRVHDDDNQEILLVEAELLYKTEHLYMWVERGVNINQDRLAQAAETFERDIYPTNRAFFGSENTPGIDGDPHLSVLHARQIGSGVAGYYWSADQYTAEVRPDSNQTEMFYINADNASVGSDFYLGTLAHEFQHMIHWHQDRNEETWLNEAMSELASLINGFDPGGSEYAWAQRPDTQLNTWSDDSSRSAHYGASFLFATYLMDRFGETMTQAVVRHPANGIASIDAVLAESGTGLTFTDVFADWVVASYLDAPELADGQFGYEQIDTPQPRLDAQHNDYPIERMTDVSQYGVDYIYLAGGRDLTLDFYGNTRARLVDTQAYSGDYFWYANRGDDSNMRLTQTFDLSDLNQATLSFWTWYDIESDWDYGYVQVSNNDGATWQILSGPSTTDSNPNGNNFGWGYTGYSGGGPTWIEEQIDLSAYAGQQLQVRFEYVTDDALNNPGWAIDDVAILELDYLDDVEQDEHGWHAEGFVRINNYVPQGHLVQLITFGAETTVQRLPLRTDQTAHWPLALAEADHAVLLVSGLAPVTTEAAHYFYRLEEMP
jgi:immune inhibitor A